MSSSGSLSESHDILTSQSTTYSLCRPSDVRTVVFTAERSTVGAHASKNDVANDQYLSPPRPGSTKCSALSGSLVFECHRLVTVVFRPSALHANVAATADDTHSQPNTNDCAHSRAIRPTSHILRIGGMHCQCCLGIHSSRCAATHRPRGNGSGVCYGTVRSAEIHSGVLRAHRWV